METARHEIEGVEHDRRAQRWAEKLSRGPRLADARGQACSRFANAIFHRNPADDMPRLLKSREHIFSLPRGAAIWTVANMAKAGSPIEIC